MDRSQYPTRKLTLADEGTDDDVAAMTPAQRVEIVWQLTLQAWAFLENDFAEPRVRRDLVRTVRPPRSPPPPRTAPSPGSA